MKIKLAPKWSRALELTLWAVGLVLIGVPLGASFDRWRYQAEQERLLFAQPAMAAAPAPLPVVTRPVTRPVTRKVPAPTPPVARNSDPIGPVMPAALEKQARADTPPAPEAPPASTSVPKPAARKETTPRSAFGLIEIPRLGLRAIVREGADEKTLARAVGLVPGGAYPGQTGNTILAGHRDTFFWPLRRIRVDDRIRVVVPPETYEYRVSSVKIVAPEETSVLESRDVEELTLVTCYPFTFVGPAPERFIVSAVRAD